MSNTIFFTGLILILLVLLEYFNKKEKVENIIFMERTYTDALRGCASLLIVISHVSGLTGTRIATPLGGIGVAIFLICSGYGLYFSYKNKGLSKFWISRIKRVLIPYWIAILIYYCLSYKYLPAINVKDIVREILLIGSIPYMWFVQYLIAVSIIFWVVYKFVPVTYRNRVLIVISVISLIVLKNDLYAEQSLSFVSGIMLAETKDKIKINKKILLRLGILCFFIATICLVLKQITFIRMGQYIIFNIVQTGIKLGGALGITLILKQCFNICGNALSKIGLYSYEIYIVHTLFITYLIRKGINLINIIEYTFLCILGIIILHNILKVIK